ncbi:MFS transporter (plasmid) [Streptomyces sp. BI20]|uniref:MFS transporter n=1 Tax=Streptomyces sp. BI20 TaxID=3403460 RepID=UPI003C77D3DA
MVRGFGALWTAYAVSALGTWLAFDAFTLVAILALHAGAGQVALLAAVGPAVGALVALPLGPWVEFRRKRRVMIATDLVRAAALVSVPVALACGLLSLTWLLVVAVVVGASDIAFTAAAGAFLKSFVPGEELVRANGRFEGTTWTATMLGPPLGGALVGALGPAVTVLANAASHLLSALALRAVPGPEPRPVPPDPARRTRLGDLFAGWRHLLSDPVLRPLFLNAVLFNALVMATAPPLAVLLLGEYGVPPWLYGLVFALPCAGGLIGSRLAPRLVLRHGADRVLRTAGVLRACWLPALAFVGPGAGGPVLVALVEFGMILCIGVFNPVLAARRLERTPPDRVARTLTAWSITSRAAIAGVTGLWGLLAAVGGPRTALAAAGLCALATPFLLPRRQPAPTP